METEQMLQALADATKPCPCTLSKIITDPCQQCWNGEYDDEWAFEHSKCCEEVACKGTGVVPSYPEFRAECSCSVSVFRTHDGWHQFGCPGYRPLTLAEAEGKLNTLMVAYRVTIEPWLSLIGDIMRWQATLWTGQREISDSPVLALIAAMHATVKDKAVA